jgi:hypothetical protein
VESALTNVSRRTNKSSEPWFGGAGEFAGLTAPGETDGAGMEGLMVKDEPGALLVRQADLDEREIQVLVAAVKLVADNRMAKVREVDADLMFPAGERFEAE